MGMLRMVCYVWVCYVYATYTMVLLWWVGHVYGALGGAAYTMHGMHATYTIFIKFLSAILFVCYVYYGAPLGDPWVGTVLWEVRRCATYTIFISNIIRMVIIRSP